ncbi:MAG: hypothetical protein OXG85_15315 [Chloroflexi bacterium]|nr:hypothetical protein [Chloroflexota bacterium]
MTGVLNLTVGYPDKEFAMRSQIAPFIRLFALLLSFVIGASAQDRPTVTITPESGEAERAVFTIEIDGLQPDTEYRVEIVFAGAVVFSSEETSDQAGHIPYPISSTEGDAPGRYTLRVLLDGAVIASADFELTEAEAAPSEEGEGGALGDVTVTPQAAPFGKVQTLRVADLAPNTQYTLEITASETLQVAYRRLQTSDENSLIEIEIFAEEGDAAGLQLIAVYDSAGDLIAEGSFTILAPPTRDVSVTVTPPVVTAGNPVEIALKGMAEFDSVSVQITTADGLLIDTLLARASSAGETTLAYDTPAGLADGDYQLDIFVESDLLASAALTVGEGVAAEPLVTLSVDPPSASIGQEHRISAAGLAADQAFTLVILDPAGAEEYSAARQADSAGEFSLTISSTEEDDTGAYTVEIRADDSGALLASATFEITAAAAETDDEMGAAPAEEDAPSPAEPDAIASIEPGAAPIGSTHRVAVRNLGANETVAIDVRFAGASVYMTEKTADESGAISLDLVTDADDQPGDYTIQVLRESGNQPSVVLTATATAAPADSVGDAEVISSRLSAGRADIEFDGVARQTVLIKVQSEDFDPAAALIGPGDMALAFNDDSRGQKDATIGPLRLPYTGEYELAISAKPLMMAQGAESGEFTVTITPVALAPIDFDSEVRFALSAETPALYYALPVETGDSLTATVDSGGALDTLLQVISPTGEEQAFDDDSGSGLDAELSNLIFDRAADYVLVISSFDAGASGEGTVRIARNPVRSLDMGEAIVTLNDKAIRDLVIFDAVEDELLVLNLEVVSGAVEDLYVTAAVEGMEVMSYSTMGVPDELPLAFVMPMSGRVVVTLEKFGFDDGISLEVSLERP